MRLKTNFNSKLFHFRSIALLWRHLIGVDKTTLAALLLDELARRHFDRKLLVIDADPAATLALTLALEAPAATLAEIRDSTPLDAGQIRRLPPGASPAAFVRDRLESKGAIARRRLRELDFDFLQMQGCSVL